MASSNPQLSNAIVDDLNTDVARIWRTEANIEEKTKQLMLLSKTFGKETAQWLQMYTTFNDALKEVGDVENWLGAIETDMRVVSNQVIAQSLKARSRTEAALKTEQERQERRNKTQ